MSIKILNQEGLEFLKTVQSNTVDLVLTDPPYITSRQTGMQKWAEHVKRQDAPGARPAKSQQDWERHIFVETGQDYWLKFFENSNVVDKNKACARMREDYLKYGSIYGTKYAVTTDYGDWDSQFDLETLNKFASEFHRVLRPGGSAIIFFDIWKITNLKDILESNKFKQLRFIEWIKTNPQPLNSSRNYLTNCREIALMGVKKGSPTFNSKYDNAVYHYPLQGGKDRFHPTQKSLPLFEELIRKHSNKGDLVLDPFLGSATTAVAAKRTDRSFVGCEVDKEFYQKSIDRVSRS